ncbi:MAG: hypothetical protein ACXV79_16565 [Methylobacter sp.]
MKTTESSITNSIKFTHAESGEIDSHNGKTVFSYLFMLGAFASTRKYNSDLVCSEYQTDTDGLKVLESKASEAVSCLSDAVAALGTMMANADMDNIDTDTLRTCGWLIAGLGELIGQVSFENSEISYALSQLSKQK